MATWGDFATEAPELAQRGREILYQHGVGLAYLATTATDSAPRVHPVCPLLDDASVYVFIIPSPKQRDLLRDGRFALHSFPPPDSESAIYLTGTARVVDEPTTRARLVDQFVAERARFGPPPPAADDILFELHVDRALLTESEGHGAPNPTKTRWAAHSDGALSRS
jgi:hypothetical protein